MGKKKKIGPSCKIQILLQISHIFQVLGFWGLLWGHLSFSDFGICFFGQNQLDFSFTKHFLLGLTKKYKGKSRKGPFTAYLVHFLKSKQNNNKKAAISQPSHLPYFLALRMGESRQS